MTKRNPDPQVDDIVSESKMWREETELLRKIIRDCGLTESLKWGKPCYAIDGGNVVIIQGFKAYCALLFFKGFRLKDPKGILKKTGENTRVGRQIRFNSVAEIAEQKAILKAYIQQAIEVEKSDVKGEPEEKVEVKMPVELKDKLAGHPAFKKAFEALTPAGLQLLFFRRKTILDPRGADRKMHAADSQREGDA